MGYGGIGGGTAAGGAGAAIPWWKAALGKVGGLLGGGGAGGQMGGSGQGAATPPILPSDPPLIKLGKWASPSGCDLLSNPQFQMGLNILSANRGGGDVYQGALQGLGQASAYQNQFQQQDYEKIKREREEEAYKRAVEQMERDKQLREFYAIQQNLTPEAITRAGLLYGDTDLQGKIAAEAAQAQYGTAGEDTSNMKNYAQVQAIREKYGPDSQEEEDFWRTFRTPVTEGDSTRSAVLTNYDRAVEAQNARNQAIDLSSRLEQVVGKTPNGWESKISEFTKEVFGSEDEYTLIRRDAAKLINREVLSALPPGPATDKDILVAKTGFPPPTANAATLAAYFRGVAKIQERYAAYNNFKGDWLSENASMRGFREAWKDEYRRVFGEEASPGAEAPTVDIAELPEG